MPARTSLPTLRGRFEEDSKEQLGSFLITRWKRCIVMKHVEVQSPSISDESKQKLAQVYHLLWLLAQQADGSIRAMPNDDCVDRESDAATA
jgi:hypothetical protein